MKFDYFLTAFRKGGLLRSLTMVLMVFTLPIVMMLSLATPIIRSLVVSDELKKVDVVVVLGGGGGSRLRRGIEIYHRYKAKELLMVDELERSWDSVFYHCKVCDLKTVNHRILTGSKSTYEDALSVLKYYREKKMEIARNIVVVTGPYHTRRAKLIFASHFSNQLASVFIASSDYYHLVLSPEERWWLDEKTRITVAKEISKVIYRTPFILYSSTIGRL